MSGSPGRYTVIPSPALESLLDEALAGIGSAIETLHLPGLKAVVLGGGYGRGEGGVLHTAQGDRLYNDLDFFVFSSGADPAAARRIDGALKTLSESWEKKLGIAVDFGPVKNLESLGGVASTLMFQELLRGWKPVWGQIDLARWIPALEPDRLPFSEAVRLLLNRGMGLIFAGEYLRAGTDDPDFIVRNMMKVLLGSGDSLLIAAGAYRWRGTERTAAFAEYAKQENLPEEYVRLYERAFRYKLEPEPVLPSDPLAEWRECRKFYLDAVRFVAGVNSDATEKTVASGLSRRAAAERSFKNLLRWARRTGRVRFCSGMFDAPVVTVLGRLYGKMNLSDTYTICPAELRQLWAVFN